ncbi:MAG TPA: protein-glutamate O-methyltransferase CheR [Anaerolineae bacterium]|nr:protein-glutamate O-methyltransferase CheR [Anaerolineae bacterium]
MSEPDPEFEALLDFLRRSRGLDFTAYKRSSLMRRCLKRMQAAGVADYDSYAGYLEAHPEEFEQLFDTMLINVTSFYRDKPSWDFVEAKILPLVLERRGSVEPLRVWSAGCSTGEEAYTLAILLAEALRRSLGEAQGLEVFRRFVKIYATDVDEDALQQARRGTYPASALAPLPEGMRARYFERSGTRYTFRSDLRRGVIFGRHDLIQDPPISRLDLLVCRNTLMYLNADAQRRILARFHFALNDTGYLFVGRAEMLLTHSHLFTPLDRSHRVFAKVHKNDVRDRTVGFGEAGDEMRQPLPRFLEGTNGEAKSTLPAANCRGRAVEGTIRYRGLTLDAVESRRGVVSITTTRDWEGREQRGRPDREFIKGGKA